MTDDPRPAAEALAEPIADAMRDAVDTYNQIGSYGAGEDIAAAILAHPFTPEQRAALVAAILADHPEVLAGAIHEGCTRDQTGKPIAHDDVDAFDIELAQAYIERLEAAGKGEAR